MNAELSRTIVLWCPDWPIHAAAAEAELDGAAPLALTAAGLVYASSAAARAEGVTRGLRQREAQYRCPELVVLAYDPAVDVRRFEPVVRRIEAAVPGVQLVRPGTLAMRARGPARYYGGEPAAAAALLDTAAEAGVADARVGIADGPFVAEQAARATRTAAAVQVIDPGASARFIAPLPVSLVVDARTTTLLTRLGVRTLGELAALPVDDVRRRFGAAGALAHDQASGREHSRVLVRTPPPEYDLRQEFEPPLDRIDQLAFALRVRSEEFIERLRGARLVCTGIRIDLDDERGRTSSRSWMHPRWFGPGDVIDRVRWQLQGAGADQGLDSPIVRVRIVPERIDSTGNHEEGLWGGGPDDRIHHGLTRVQSMLGHDGVVTASIGGGRMLAERQVLVPWGDRAPTPSTAPWPGSLPALAPASVFRERAPIALLDERGETVTIDGRGEISAPPVGFGAIGALRLAPVRAWTGPWPVVERWWDAARARRVHRFQVVDHDGSAWLLVRDAEGWWAEARYD